LESADASALGFLSPRNQQHAMTPLAALSKYTGRYDQFLKIRQRYNLKWTSGKESLQTFEGFFNDELNYNIILGRIPHMISKTRTQRRNLSCLTVLLALDHLKLCSRPSYKRVVITQLALKEE
jgi:hypothetical protein